MPEIGQTAPRHRIIDTPGDGDMGVYGGVDALLVRGLISRWLAEEFSRQAALVDSSKGESP